MLMNDKKTIHLRGGHIDVCDCMRSLVEMGDNQVDLVVTSPPYNKAWYSKVPDNAIWQGAKVDYDGFTDCVDPSEYAMSQKKVLEQLLRVLKPTGSIFYNHKDVIHKGRIVHPSFVYDFPVHQVCVWNRRNSPMISTRYYLPVTEYFFWITKEPSGFYFDRKSGILTSNVWDVQAERGNSHPAPFPLSIIQSIVAQSCPEGGAVYDPYLGSGTTAVATILSGGGRTWSGNEISVQYVDMAQKRILDIEV